MMMPSCYGSEVLPIIDVYALRRHYVYAAAYHYAITPFRLRFFRRLYDLAVFEMPIFMPPIGSLCRVCCSSVQAR